MLRTGEQYRASIRDGREVWIDGEQASGTSAGRPSPPGARPMITR